MLYYEIRDGELIW